MPEINFTPDQEAQIRAALGFADNDRPLTADDIVLALEVRRIVEEAWRGWLDGR